MFFSATPPHALLSDTNARLIETYEALKSDWRSVVRILGKHHKQHSYEYYYAERAKTTGTPASKAARFIYLNRSCWNGLYRVNRKGEFNVPIGTKDWVLSPSDNFPAVAAALSVADLACCDFEVTINRAEEGDLIFADPPYTVAHNFNGFVKYNETIFSWSDQERLAKSLSKAIGRGVNVVATNANHPSVTELYQDFAELRTLTRASVISGQNKGRQSTTELLILGGEYS